MAKATTTIKQTLTYLANHRDWLASNQALFNRVASFYLTERKTPGFIHGDRSESLWGEMGARSA